MSKPGGEFSRTQIFLWTYKRNSAPLTPWLQESWLPELWTDTPLLFKTISFTVPEEIQQGYSPEGWGQQRSFSGPPSSIGLLSAAGWAMMNLQLWVGLPRQPAGAAPACISILWYPQRLLFVSFPIIAHVGTPDLGVLTYFLFVLLALYCGSCCFTLCPDILPLAPKWCFSIVSLWTS